MTPSADFSGLERFRTAIAACLGLHFDDTKLTLLDEVLQRRLNATRLSPTRYFSRLRQNDPAEVGELARELTVGETYFFRHAEQLRVFGDVVLASRTGGRRVRVLSAGCASGEEAYSLAMVARERGRDVPAEVSILGVDVNPAAIQKARRGRFSTWALRGMPEDVKQRWLRHDGRDFVIDESLKDVVQFEEANLAD